ncbi:MAG: tetratricopeptide repeat protein [Rhizobiales bacterium]|nr:tetratricopeptide repeat protein [Hyphomicrobiales bacterium]
MVRGEPDLFRHRAVFPPRPADSREQARRRCPGCRYAAALGKCAEHKGKPEAGELFRRSQEVRESALGAANLNLLPALEELTNRQLRTFRIEDAVSCQKRCIELVEKIHGPQSGEAAATLLRLGNLLLRTKQPAEAEPLLRRALAIRATMKTPDDIRLAATLDALIRTLGCIGACGRDRAAAATRPAGQSGHADQRSRQAAGSLCGDHPGDRPLWPRRGPDVAVAGRPCHDMAANGNRKSSIEYRHGPALSVPGDGRARRISAPQCWRAMQRVSQAQIPRRTSFTTRAAGIFSIIPQPLRHASPMT